MRSSWTGPLPTRCDLCQSSIDDRFVDGVVKGPFCWAKMCIPCFRREGIGLGVGRGQMYDIHTRKQIIE